MKRAAKQAQNPAGGNQQEVHWTVFLILTVTPFFLYWQTTRFGLIWDDISVHLINNPHLLPANSENLLYFWKETYMGLYVPVTYNTWTLLSGFFSTSPKDPFAYHLFNNILHTANGLLVFALLRRFLKNPWDAMVGTLLFLIHPLQAETVAWISEFRGLLATFFGLSGLSLYLKSLS
ncbi:MAG: hypothetical protein QF645_10995, partial [Planctomycetota bacterium]|nr:hypothetical protein [Planctomycetota bacterium]